MYWGYHVMQDCSGCAADRITSRENLVQFTKELVKRIDMVAFGEPTVEHFATHDPNKAGYSMVQLIETSSITAHFVDHDRTMYLDVFSCKTFDLAVVQDTVREFFGATKIRMNYVTRNAD